MTKRTINVSDEELVALLQEARADRVLTVAWGSGALYREESNRWAIERIAEMRGAVDREQAVRVASLVLED